MIHAARTRSVSAHATAGVGLLVPAVLISAISYIRVLATGNPKVDTDLLLGGPRSLALAGFTLSLLAASAVFVAVVRRSPRFDLDRRQTRSLARWLAIVSAPAIQSVTSSRWNHAAWHRAASRSSTK